MVSKDGPIGLAKVVNRGFRCLACQEYLMVGHMYYQIVRVKDQHLCIDCAREQGLVW